MAGWPDGRCICVMTVWLKTKPVTPHHGHYCLHYYQSLTSLSLLNSNRRRISSLLYTTNFQCNHRFPLQTTSDIRHQTSDISSYNIRHIKFKISPGCIWSRPYGLWSSWWPYDRSDGRMVFRPAIRPLAGIFRPATSPRILIEVVEQAKKIGVFGVLRSS